MGDEFTKTADWAPGTLDKTRKNIGDISASDAAIMAKKLGGEVMYERSENSGANNNPNRGGRIVRKTVNSTSGKTSSSGVTMPQVDTRRRYTREDLPSISKKEAALMDKLMMSSEFKIKPNYGFFNFLRSLQKNGTEKIIPEFYTYSMKQMIEHMEAFITVIKTLIQIAPATYKSKIASSKEAKFKFLRMVAGWKMQNIKVEYINVQRAPKPLILADLIPVVRAFYKPLISVYYYGINKIPKLIKEIYADEAAYPDSPKDTLSNYAKQAITEWLYVENEIIKKLYPLLMRMCSNSFEVYPDFFNTAVGDILKFVEIHKFELLLPDKNKPEEEEKKKPREAPPKKGVKDASVITGLKLLNQLFPEAGFNKLESHPDFFPYFQPLYNFRDGFNMLSPENPLQFVLVMLKIIEDCFHGCISIKFIESDQERGSDSITSIMDDWAAYREDTFGHLYCEPLTDLVNSIYSQPDFASSQMGKKLITSLLWQTTYHFMPNFKFEQLLLEHPADESKYRPLYHRTDYARKFLTLVVNECDNAKKNKGPCKLIENPWEHYNFPITNEVSKRLDVLLGAKNTTENTSATNANLLKYTLCFISVLDWWINNPDSPAHTSNPMHIWRVSEKDGKPSFSVPERTDQNKLFADEIRASYQKAAK